MLTKNYLNGVKLYHNNNKYNNNRTATIKQNNGGNKMIEIGKPQSRKYRIYVEKEGEESDIREKKLPTLSVVDNTNTLDVKKIRQIIELAFVKTNEALGNMPKTKHDDVEEDEEKMVDKGHYIKKAYHKLKGGRAKPKKLMRTLSELKKFIKSSATPLTWEDIIKQFPNIYGGTYSKINKMLKKSHYGIEIWREGRWIKLGRKSLAKGKVKKVTGKRHYNKKSEFFSFVSEGSKKLMKEKGYNFMTARRLTVEEWNKAHPKATIVEQKIIEKPALASVLARVTEGFSISEDEMQQYLWNAVGQGEMNMCDIKGMSERHYLDLSRKVILYATQIEKLMGLAGHFRIHNQKLVYAEGKNEDVTAKSW